MTKAILPAAATRQALLSRHDMLDLALDAAEMGAWRHDLVARQSRLDARAQRLYGVDGEMLDHSEDGMRALVHPDDLKPMWRAIARATAPGGDGRYEVDYRVRRSDGGWRWLRAWGRAEFEAPGQRGEAARARAARIVGASRDVTAEKTAERQRELLVEELNHRVKNTLAIVQAIAAQTLRSAASKEEFAEAFLTRMDALARTHSLLARNFWEAAPLGQVVETTLAPFAGAERAVPAIACEGPALTVGTGAAVTLSLMLHELATNAAKYGALSVPGGAVRVLWRPLATAEDAAPMAELTWGEAGGPPVNPPTTRGFGSRMIVASARQLGGAVEHRFDPEGVFCRLRVPLAAAGHSGAMLWPAPE